MSEVLDVNVIRDDPEAIRAMLRNRTYSEDVLDKFLELDQGWRAAVEEGNRLRKQRNEASLRIAKLGGTEKAEAVAEMKKVASRISELEATVVSLEAQRDEVILLIPNVPHITVPIGDSYEKNRVVMEFGKVTKFDFQPKDHIALGEDLDIIDFQRGVKVAGSGFFVLKGDGARMERALINYMLDLHHQQGYTEVFPPVVVNRAAVIGTGQYPKMKDDMYWCERDDLWLNPTAEVPVTNLHQDDILTREDLPINYTAYLPSFRREAGRHAEMKGMIRVHEFNKVELVKFVLPDGSFQELETLLNDAQDVLRGLELPFRTLLLCTGDMGFASAKTYDLESHAPGTGSWLEVSSCSCFTDFQARRARIKYRPEAHLKSEFVHTLNGSGLALPRTMVSIMENNQDREGRIRIPKVLRPYMQGQELIE
ncbi:MAG TPA: serine--tRNA ligase [Methanomassiliicoccales archaeon]|nr:serine--tRNA ligase [Methanomassiliicoccales archaeon]HPR99004.1 serine--tRNA ligase [Methanomassiliicoccales archaeon]